MCVTCEGVSSARKPKGMFFAVGVVGYKKARKGGPGPPFPPRQPSDQQPPFEIYIKIFWPGPRVRIE